MITGAIMKEHPLPRWPRFMVLDWAFSLPFLSAFMRKVGGVPASPHKAMRILSDDGLMMVFRTFDRVSYALVLEIGDGVKVGDRFISP